jgi:hypothetical protein
MLCSMLSSIFCCYGYLLCRSFCLLIWPHSTFTYQRFIFVTVGLYLHLAVSVVHEIKDALGIYCFRSANLCYPTIKKTGMF